MEPGIEDRLLTLLGVACGAQGMECGAMRRFGLTRRGNRDLCQAPCPTALLALFLGRKVQRSWHVDPKRCIAPHSITGAP